MLRTVASTLLVGAAALAAPAAAQEPTTIGVTESPEYGRYLQTGEGRAVYLFTADTRGTADSEPQISCTTVPCLEAWPLVTTQGAPQAGEGADPALLGTLQHDGATVVTYNGWPLYTYAADTGTATPAGQDAESFGGEWYLLTPAGEDLHAE